MYNSDKLKADIKKLIVPSLVVGVAGTAALAAAYFTGNEETKNLLFEAYLMAFMLVVGLSLGSLGILLISHLATGRWSHFIQRPLEAAAKNIVLCAVLFVGVWAGRHHLYGEWMDRSAEGLAQKLVPLHHHPVEEFNSLKHAWMTYDNWVLRAIIDFAIWFLMTYLLTTWSKKQDATKGGEPWGKRMRVLSGVGIIVYGLTVTILAFDLLVALNSMWFSSIYGAKTFASFVLTTMSFMAILTCWMRDREPLKIIMTNRQTHDIGTLMFAFTVLWTYMSASQLIIIWNANLYEETIFYFKRIEGGWPVVTWFIFFGAFIGPFLLLMSQPLKRNKKILATIAVWVIIMRCVDFHWQICPWFHAAKFHWVFIAAPVGLLGLWLAAFFWNLQRNPAPAYNDPRYRALIYDAAHHGEHH